MSSVSIECVARESCRIGESPVWDDREGALLYVDITGRKVCRWSPVSRQAQAIALGKEPWKTLPVCGSRWKTLPVCGSCVLGLGLCPPAAALAQIWRPFPTAWVSSVASTLGDTRYRPDLVLGVFPYDFFSTGLCLIYFLSL